MGVIFQAAMGYTDGMSRPCAVLLLSGGVDSTTTTTAIALADGFDVYAMTFDYGQRHRLEIDRARREEAGWRVFGSLRRHSGCGLTWS